jgi:hypothetical protein
MRITQLAKWQQYVIAVADRWQVGILESRISPWAPQIAFFDRGSWSVAPQKSQTEDESLAK